MDVLVIDDDFDQRLLIIRELERAFSNLHTQEIVSPEDFAEAIEMGQFDISIIDYRLRWSNGLDILQTLKDRYPDRPVIMFTETGSQEIAVEAMKSGLDDYILKSPKHYVRLCAAVRAALERSETQRRAERLEIRLESLLERLNVGVFRATPDGTLLEGNRAFLRLLGFLSLTDAKAHSLQELFFREEQLHYGQRQERELQIHRANGELIWVLLSETLNTSNGQTVIDGLIEDITGRKRAEESLKRYARRLQTLQELDRSILQARSPAEIAQVALTATALLVPCQLLDITLFDLDTRQAIVLAAQSNTGLGLQAGDRFSLEDLEAIEALQQNRVIVREDLSTQSYLSPIHQQLCKQGIRFLMNVPVSAQGRLIGSLNVGTMQPEALTDEDREIIYEISNQLAIAIEQSRLREQLQRYTERLEQEVHRRTQQLEEANSNLEAFTYSVSHDLREPLRSLQLYAQILTEEHTTQLDETGLIFTKRIHENAKRMDKLLQNLLTYSRLSRAELSLQSINLSFAVREVLSQLEVQLLETNAQVTIQEPLLDIVGHYTTLIQVITNLITNATKFVATQVQPQVQIRTERREDSVRLWIEDNGIGIDERYSERIFRIFERLHSADTYPGNGAGLAIVRKGVERMGGQVGVESTLGEGSRFWIELLAADS